jgi:hypothetical protein
VYCGKRKASSELTLEHIVPQRLGGALCSDLFKSRRVCERCNNLCGLFVDGAFLKNWFATNFHAESARCYVNLEAGSVLPLIYLGELRANPLGTQDAVDLWLSPTGDQVFHVHPPHDERYAAYAGGDPIRFSREPGAAILFSRTSNQAWLKTSLLSFAAHFHRARRVLANVGLQSDQDRALIGGVPREPDRVWIDALQRLGDSAIPVRFSVQQGFEQRFLAKLALGIGHNLLGDPFLGSPFAQRLRQALWERDFLTRARLAIPWTSFWESDEALRRVIGWPGATTIVLHPVPPFLVLSLSVFDRTPLHVAISDDPGIWAQPSPVEVGEFGSAFVLIPQRRYFSGRVALTAYLGELHSARGVPELRRTHAWRVDPASSPPFEDPEPPI